MMYRLEVNKMDAKDRETIVNLMMPGSDSIDGNGRVFDGTVKGIGSISAYYEDHDTAYARALTCETTVFCIADVEKQEYSSPMREKLIPDIKEGDVIIHKVKGQDDGYFIQICTLASINGSGIHTVSISSLETVKKYLSDNKLQRIYMVSANQDEGVYRKPKKGLDVTIGVKE